jgi:integrase
MERACPARSKVRSAKRKLPHALPSEGVKPETRCFTDDEVRSIITHAAEPLSTIVAITAVLGLRIGETLALRTYDVDFAKHIIRVRQSVDAATRIVAV